MRDLAPCSKCGGAKARGKGRYCPPCRAEAPAAYKKIKLDRRRKPCARCGGPKEPGKKRVCAACKPHTVAERSMFHKHRLRTHDLEAMMAAAGGKCESCRRELVPGQGTTKRHIDHCHTTGKIRGLLCGACNMALGLLGDTPAGVRGLLAYIEKTA